MSTSIEQVASRLGSLEATAEHQDKRLDKIDNKLDAVLEKMAVIDHMRNNINMMKKPVEDYQRVKERGLGMWSLLTFLIGAATVVFNIVSYVFRVYVFKIGE